MAVERQRVGCVYSVSGQDWMEQDHEVFWKLLRDRWHADLQAGGWQLCEDPRETIEYDEQNRHVLLYIRAVAEREDDGLVGPPAGRDRFA